jgi:predicted phage terminase large subunit-like protein
MCYSVKDGTLYILDMWVVNLGLPEFKEGMVSFLERTGYSSMGIIRFEPKATGISVVQEMKTMRDKRGMMYNVVEASTPKDSKITRVQSVLPFIEAGNVCLVRGAWNDSFVTECKQFPNGVHDDQVDTLSAVIDIEINSRIDVNIGFV